MNRKTFKTSVKPGWYYFGRKMVRSHFARQQSQNVPRSHVDVDSQDTADLEWMMWFSTFKAHILFALSGHVLFAKICTMLAVQVILLTGGGCTKEGLGVGG